MKNLLILTVSIFATPAFALDCDDGMRAFVHHADETCIPVQPQRIVAARGDSLATPLLDLGAPIIGAGFREMEDGTIYLRGASDIFGDAFVTAANLTNVGNPNSPDLEVIAGLNPDLIIIRVWDEDALAQYQAIAPTIMAVPNSPFLDHLAFLADAAGVQGTYDDKIAAYEAQIAEARANIAAPEDIVISRFDVGEDGLWYYPNWGGLDQVITDIGFTRPTIQADARDSMNGVSFEFLPEFDGDVLITSTAPRFGQTVAMLTELQDSQAPFWRELPGVAAGNHDFYGRDVCIGNTFKSLDAAIDGLELLTAGRTFQ